MPRSYSSPGSGYGYGGGSHFFFLPGWGWRRLWLRRRLGALSCSRSSATRCSQSPAPCGAPARAAAARWTVGGYADGDEAQVAPGRAYVYKLQVGLGRSARGVQQRLEQFATNGDTESEAGLAALLQQSALELCARKIRSATPAPRRMGR